MLSLLYRFSDHPQSCGWRITILCGTSPTNERKMGMVQTSIGPVGVPMIFTILRLVKSLMNMIQNCYFLGWNYSKRAKSTLNRYFWGVNFTCIHVVKTLKQNQLLTTRRYFFPNISTYNLIIQHQSTRLNGDYSYSWWVYEPTHLASWVHLPSAQALRAPGKGARIEAKNGPESQALRDFFMEKHTHTHIYIHMCNDMYIHRLLDMMCNQWYFILIWLEW